jgi:hypothetical protein
MKRALVSFLPIITKIICDKQVYVQLMTNFQTNRTADTNHPNSALAGNRLLILSSISCCLALGDSGYFENHAFTSTLQASRRDTVQAMF